MGELQPWHIIIIVLVVLLLFGSKRLPDGARALGRSLRIFRSEVKSMHDDDDPKATEPTAQAQLPAPLPPAAEPAPPTVPPAERPQATTAQQDPVTAGTTGPTGQPPASS